MWTEGKFIQSRLFHLNTHWTDLDAFKNSDAQALHAGDSDMVSYGAWIFVFFKSSIGV